MKTLSFFLNTADKRTLGGALTVNENIPSVLAQTVELRIDDERITIPRVQFDMLISTVYGSETQ